MEEKKEEGMEEEKNDCMSGKCTDHDMCEYRFSSLTCYIYHHSTFHYTSLSHNLVQSQLL